MSDIPKDEGLAVEAMNEHFSTLEDDQQGHEAERDR
jgi:hypothetical protein